MGTYIIYIFSIIVIFHHVFIQFTYMLSPGRLGTVTQVVSLLTEKCVRVINVIDLKGLVFWILGSFHLAPHVRYIDKSCTDKAL